MAGIARLMMGHRGASRHVVSRSQGQLYGTSVNSVVLDVLMYGFSVRCGVKKKRKGRDVAMAKTSVKFRNYGLLTVVLRRVAHKVPHMR